MDPVFFYATDEISAKALNDIFTNKMTDICKAIQAPADTKEVYDRPHKRVTMTYPHKSVLLIEPCTVNVQNKKITGIKLSLEKIKKKDGLGDGQDIVARVKNAIGQALVYYPPIVVINSVNLIRKEQEDYAGEKVPDTAAAPFRHFLAWIVALLIAPLNAAIMIGWYYLVQLFLGWLSSLGTVYTIFDIIDDAISDEAGTGILGVIATIFLGAVIYFMIRASQKLYPSRRDRRYKVTCVLGLLLLAALLIGYIKHQDYIQATYNIGWMFVIYVLFAIGLSSIWLLACKHTDL